MSEPLPVHRHRLIVACAWCRSVLNRDRGAGIAAEAKSCDVTHTICPVCLTMHFGELDDHDEPRASVPSESGASLRSGRPQKGGRSSFRIASVALLAVIASGCANRPSFVGRTMPHPDGCFVQVWDQPRFGGASDFINGPRRYETLRDLPGRHNWANRIRSLKLGDSASLTVWSEDRFRGSTVTFTDDSQQPQRFSTVAPKIGSLSINCRTLATD